MPNYWKIPGVPHKGWRLIDVEDIREEGQSEWETDYESCMMCGNDKIRYVHIVSNDEYGKELRVGCNCAEKMTGDYVNPEQRERELRNRASRKSNWKNREWRVSRNDNYFFNYENHHLLIFRDKLSGKLKLKIDDRYGNKKYDDIDIAKIAAFKNVEYLKEKGKW